MLSTTSQKIPACHFCSLVYVWVQHYLCFCCHMAIGLTLLPVLVSLTNFYFLLVLKTVFGTKCLSCFIQWIKSVTLFIFPSSQSDAVVYVCWFSMSCNGLFPTSLTFLKNSRSSAAAARCKVKNKVVYSFFTSQYLSLHF